MSTTPVMPELALMSDVPMSVEVELDRRVVKLLEVLELRAGTVLPLTKPAGEPLDIYVSGARLGNGEVVVFNENFGIRITSLASGA
jgi:flagellar motor switch protein FliN/FliY